MASREFDYLFKLVLIGDASVGKTSLLLRFADDNFDDNYVSTVGVDFRFRTVTVDNKLVKLQIWDTAGQERFRTITSAYYRGAHGVILVYDVTEQETFKHVQNWLDEVHKCAGSTVTKLLVGNKADLVESRKIQETDAKSYADSVQASFIETSAKTAANVDKAFMTIAKTLVQTVGDTSKPTGENKLTTHTTTKEEGCKCCLIL